MGLYELRTNHQQTPNHHETQLPLFGTIWRKRHEKTNNKTWHINKHNRSPRHCVVLRAHRMFDQLLVGYGILVRQDVRCDVMVALHHSMWINSRPPRATVNRKCNNSHAIGLHARMGHEMHIHMHGNRNGKLCVDLHLFGNSFTCATQHHTTQH